MGRHLWLMHCLLPLVIGLSTPPKPLPLAERPQAAEQIVMLTSQGGPARDVWGWKRFCKRAVNMLHSKLSAQRRQRYCTHSRQPRCEHPLILLLKRLSIVNRLYFKDRHRL